MPINKIEAELESFFKNPGRFSVLVLGARGIGKSKMINEVGEKVLKGPPTYFNCASVEGDTMALSELFGHVKGAFTGAVSNKSGLFHEANKSGMLFFDEIHNLNKRVQEKLMTALQTVNHKGTHGWYRFRRVGSDSEEFARFQPVFASNRTVEELEKMLLPDLFDRINQLGLYLPSVQEQEVKPSAAFATVWKNMLYTQYIPVDASAFNTWLDSLPLAGNYRDLEKIAVLLQQALINEDKDPFGYAKRGFERFNRTSGSAPSASAYNFRRGATLAKMEFEYREALYRWAVSPEGYGSTKAAQKDLKYAKLSQLLDVKKE
ncbi:MAG: sigma 54-interacting transcriptional regulator [Flavobacteriales bacterium]